MSELFEQIASLVKKQLEARHKRIENAVIKIMRDRFGIHPIDEIKNFAATKKYSLVYDMDGELIGISVNNRWLYTTDGRTIGKQGKRYNFRRYDYGTLRI